MLQELGQLNRSMIQVFYNECISLNLNIDKYLCTFLPQYFTLNNFIFLCRSAVRVMDEYNRTMNHLLWFYDHKDIFAYMKNSKLNDYWMYQALTENDHQVRRWRVRPIFQTRKQDGYFHNLFPQMAEEDPDKFINFFRMTPDLFDHLATLVETYLQKDTRFRDDVILPKERLAVTIRFTFTFTFPQIDCLSGN